MAFTEIFAYPVLYKYKAPLCSKATIFVVFINLITFIIPFLLAYRSYGFWLKTDTYIEQPNVLFKHKYLIIAETDSQGDSTIICNNLNEIDLQLERKNRCYIITTKDNDVNMDGKADEIEFETEIQLNDNEKIFSIKVFLIFDVQLNALCKLEMESLGMIEYSSTLSGARLDVITELKLEQRNPLIPTPHIDKQYNNSVISDNLYNLFLPSIIKNYSKRNVTTKFYNEYKLWQSGRILNEPFILNVHILIPEQTVTYQPGFWQVMKWAWLQYISIFIIIKYITSSLQKWVFKNQLLPIIKMSPPWIKPF